MGRVVHVLMNFPYVIDEFLISGGVIRVVRVVRVVRVGRVVRVVRVVRGAVWAGWAERRAGP